MRDGAGNWNAITSAAALPAPPLIVINPPQDPVAQAVLLVTAVLWMLAAWRRATVTTRP
ncbi:hypothetical protein [Streptomyces sp. NPDC101150]|uniref:hypothetical protein n=1 Tax=Streptomyces sp. NPDC101150 TaxID=3366114 RepID=UPI0038138CEB